MNCLPNHNNHIENKSNKKIKQRTARDTLSKITNFDSLLNTIISEDILNELYQIELNEAKRIQVEGLSGTKGGLHIRRLKDKYYFSCMQGSKEKSISGNPDLVNRMARKRFLTHRSRDIKNNLDLLAKAARVHKEAACSYKSNKEKDLNLMLRAGIDSAHLFYTDEQLDWIDSAYSPNPYNTDQLIHQTENGIYVRSKLEAILGTALEHWGIPYRYDDIVEIREIGRNEHYMKNYFADFKIPNLRGGISILEIFGLIENPGYADSALKRLYDYNHYHVARHNEIFFAFEHDITDQIQLKKLIRRMLFPF